MKKKCDDPLGEFDSDEDDEPEYKVKNQKVVMHDPNMNQWAIIDNKNFWILNKIYNI